MTDADIEALLANPGPDPVEQAANAAGYSEGNGLPAFRLGYAHRGRYGAEGENAGISVGDMPAYKAGLEARLSADTTDADLAAARQP